MFFSSSQFSKRLDGKSSQNEANWITVARMAGRLLWAADLEKGMERCSSHHEISTAVWLVQMGSVRPA